MRLIITVFLGLMMLFTYGQQNPKIDKKKFFSEPNGIEDAKSSLAKGDKFYRKGKGLYDEALKYYLKVYQYNSGSNELNYKIGICYLFGSDKQSALSFFLKSSPEAASDYYLALGKAYQYNNKFDNAITAYNSYLNTLNWFEKRDNGRLINQLISECNFGKEATKDSLPVFIVNLGPIINTFYDDYNAILPVTDTMIYFTSKRPEKEPSKRVSRFKFKEQVLTTSNCIKQPAKWILATEDLTSSKNLSLAGFDKKEKRIYLYEGKWGNGTLYSAIYDRGKWRKVKALKGGINHIAYKETSISLDNEGNAYFVTDRRGGEGGKDIWYAKYKKKQKWCRAENLGPAINTPFDEEGVYVSSDGKTLYFSSKGLPGMGGFDVYKALKDEKGNWGKPKNIGYPINSPADEIFYQPTADSLVALYSTMRKGGFGGLDIYKIQIDPRKPFSLIGSVSDIETGKTLNALVNVYDNKTQKNILSGKVDEMAGIFLIKFEDIGDYTVQVNYEGYKPFSDSLVCPNEKNATLNKEYKLERIRNPFTLIGTVTDVDKGTPIAATLVLKNPNGSIIGTTMTEGSSGKYSYSFEDKLDFIIEVTATNYFDVQEPVSAINSEDNIISRNFTLKVSKVDYVFSGRVTEIDSIKSVYAVLNFYRPGADLPELIVVSDSTTGRFSATLPDAGPYMIEIEAPGFFFLNDALQFKKDQTFQLRNFALRKMESGAKLVIENILFNTGKATLLPQSFASLDKFAELLAKNPKIKIEVSGHTDNVGSASVNKRISKERALTVKNYLVNKGIEDERITYEGYGFDQPIAPNDTPEGREKNRRVEIKVLK
jgi:outer membrane protein OmpA-like peptidoglycan-associated protein/tetratricopeptide (TPR) repeat protein